MTKKQVLDGDSNQVKVSVGVKKDPKIAGTVGYKAVRDQHGKPCIATLVIPFKARVCGSMANVGKLRADRVYVKRIDYAMLGMTSTGGRTVGKGSPVPGNAYSFVYPKAQGFTYRAQTWITVKKFERGFRDGHDVCMPGIHYCLSIGDLADYFALLYTRSVQLTLKSKRTKKSNKTNSCTMSLRKIKVHLNV